MMEPLYGIYGAAGCGRGVMPLARAQLLGGATSVACAGDRLVFIDANARASRVNGQRVLTRDSFNSERASQRFAAIAIADSRIRERIWNECQADGIEPWTIIAANSVVMDNVAIGPGALISPFVTITSNIQIGCAFHANIGSVIEHDCVIGNFVTFAPGVLCNGNIYIEDHAYIGAGAVIKQGKPGAPLVIGEGAVVGMGAVVTKSVLPGVTVAGNPARPLEKTS